jgi:chromosome segregation ATPase
MEGDGSSRGVDKMSEMFSGWLKSNGSQDFAEIGEAHKKDNQKLTQDLRKAEEVIRQKQESLDKLSGEIAELKACMSISGTLSGSMDKLTEAHKSLQEELTEAHKSLQEDYRQLKEYINEDLIRWASSPDRFLENAKGMQQILTSFIDDAKSRDIIDKDSFICVLSALQLRLKSIIGSF